MPKQQTENSAVPELTVAPFSKKQSPPNESPTSWTFETTCANS
jgi:hypothetical protein